MMVIMILTFAKPADQVTGLVPALEVTELLAAVTTPGTTISPADKTALTAAAMKAV
jgi:hypothetical protein